MLLSTPASLRKWKDEVSAEFAFTEQCLHFPPNGAGVLSSCTEVSDDPEDELALQCGRKASNLRSFCFQLPQPSARSWRVPCSERWGAEKPRPRTCTVPGLFLGTGALNCLKCILFVYISQRKMPAMNAPGCLYVRWWSLQVLRLRGHYQWYFQVRVSAAVGGKGWPFDGTPG